MKKITKSIDRFAQAFSDFQLKGCSWSLILKASTKYYKPELPLLADASYINGIPVLQSRLENAHQTLNQSLLLVLGKDSPLLIKIIRTTHNHSLLSPIMG